jgi:hypothetical protein
MLHHRDSIYSAYTREGQDSPIWKAKGWKSTKDMLSAVLQDETQSDADKTYAAAILKWGLAQETLKPETGAWTNQLWLSALWEHPDHWVLQDVTTEGKTTRECVCIAQNEFVLPVPQSKAATPTVEDGEI